MKENLVLIIGAMKSGTTSLFNELITHPHVTGCRPKEPGYFAFDDKFNLGADWYESLFNYNSDLHQVALDGSTDYAKFPHCGDVANRIRQYGAQPKLLYIVRHPLRRIESHARHVQFARRELGQLLSPRTDHSLDSGVSDVSIDISKYASQIDQYRSFYNAGKFKLLVLEEMSARPREMISEICEFLGIDSGLLSSEFKTHNRGSNIHRLAKGNMLWRAAQSVRPLRSVVKAAVPASLRDQLRKKMRQKVKINGRFTLAPQEEERLLETLSSDLTRLRDAYGVDIERHWGLKL